MKTPHHVGLAARSMRPGRVSAPPANAGATEWRCTRCDKLLGVCRDGRMHLRFARGHEYLVSLPATATCRGCGTLNEANTLKR